MPVFFNFFSCLPVIPILTTKLHKGIQRKEEGGKGEKIEGWKGGRVEDGKKSEYRISNKEYHMSKEKKRRSEKVKLQNTNHKKRGEVKVKGLKQGKRDPASPPLIRKK